MGEALVFDIEANGLLDATEIYMITITDVRTGVTYGYTDSLIELTPSPYGTLHDAALRLSQADFLFAHNGWRYDFPLWEKLFPSIPLSHPVLIDTRTWGATVRPHDKLKEWDIKLIKQGKLPGNLIGSESLKAWGMRLGVFKGDYDGGWETFTQEMWSYGLQDGDVTRALVLFLSERRVPWMTMWIEQDVTRIIARQERHGVRFNVVAAQELYGALKQAIGDVEREMVESFGSWYKPTGEVIPKRATTTWWAWSQEDGGLVQYSKKDAADLEDVYVSLRSTEVGAPHTKVELHRFNPGSRDDIAGRLMNKYGWEPGEFTKTGKPKIDEGTLTGLPWPEAKLADRYLMLQKRTGMLGDGANAWLKLVDENGYIHGRVNTNRANTRRMTHDHPNLAQVPNVDSAYGPEMRALFLPDEGHLMVGCDAQALEARGLGSRLAPYDGGAYARLVENFDVHRVNAGYIEKKAPDEVTKSERDAVKTPFYALVYGAGDWKLGVSIGGRQLTQVAAVRLGKKSRALLLDAIPALRQLIKVLKGRVEKYGKLRAMDGSLLYGRAAHAALNLQLQSDGALIMKVALIFADEELTRNGIEYEWVLNVHDEFQATVEPSRAEEAGQIMRQAIRAAGHFLGSECAMEGAYKVGNSWRETH